MEIDLLEFIKQRGMSKSQARGAFSFFPRDREITLIVRGDGWPELPTYRENIKIVEIPDET